MAASGSGRNFRDSWIEEIKYKTAIILCQKYFYL
jgi:hypothetical protein